MPRQGAQVASAGLGLAAPLFEVARGSAVPACGSMQGACLRSDAVQCMPDWGVHCPSGLIAAGSVAPHLRLGAPVAAPRSVHHSEAHCSSEGQQRAMGRSHMCSFFSMPAACSMQSLLLVLRGRRVILGLTRI
jgi:hypothetical protein